MGNPDFKTLSHKTKASSDVVEVTVFRSFSSLVGLLLLFPDKEINFGPWEVNFNLDLETLLEQAHFIFWIFPLIEGIRLYCHYQADHYRSQNSIDPSNTSLFYWARFILTTAALALLTAGAEQDEVPNLHVSGSALLVMAMVLTSIYYLFKASKHYSSQKESKHPWHLDLARGLSMLAFSAGLSLQFFTEEFEAGWALVVCTMAASLWYKAISSRNTSRCEMKIDLGLTLIAILAIGFMVSCLFLSESIIEDMPYEAKWLRPFSFVGTSASLLLSSAKDAQKVACRGIPVQSSFFSSTKPDC